MSVSNIRLVSEICTGLAWYIKDLHKKVNSGFFLSRYDASVQTRMRAVTDNIHGNSSNVMDFLGEMGYGDVQHNGNWSSQVHYLAMPAVLLDKFARGNSIGPEIMNQVYWMSTRTLSKMYLYHPVHDDEAADLQRVPKQWQEPATDVPDNDPVSNRLLISEICTGLAWYIKDLHDKVNDDFFLSRYDANVQTRMRAVGVNVHGNLCNVMDFLDAMGYGGLHGDGDCSFGVQYLAMPAVLLDKFARGNSIGPELMKQVYRMSTWALFDVYQHRAVHDDEAADPYRVPFGQCKPVSPWQEPPPGLVAEPLSAPDGPGETLMKSIVAGLKVFLQIVELQAYNGYLPEATQTRVLKILGYCTEEEGMNVIDFLDAMSMQCHGTQTMPSSLQNNIAALCTDHPTIWRRMWATKMYQLRTP